MQPMNGYLTCEIAGCLIRELRKHQVQRHWFDYERWLPISCEQKLFTVVNDDSIKVSPAHPVTDCPTEGVTSGEISL